MRGCSENSLGPRASRPQKPWDCENRKKCARDARGPRWPDRQLIFMRHRVRHRPVDYCFENANLRLAAWRFEPAQGRPRPARLSQNSLAATQMQSIIAEPAAERRQMVAGGASPRIGRRSDKAPEGRQKSLLFSRYLSPFQHQAQLRCSQQEGNLTFYVPQDSQVILLIHLNIRVICQFKFLRRAGARDCADRGQRRCAARPRLISLRPFGTPCFETASSDGAKCLTLRRDPSAVWQPAPTCHPAPWPACRFHAHGCAVGPCLTA